MQAPTNNPRRKPQIAFWFRYGPAEHTELLHCIPDIIEALAHDCVVHYYGLKSSKPCPQRIARNARLHILPLAINRQSTFDKFLKTCLWILLIPFMGLHCRIHNIDVVFIEETLPLSAGLARIFFGRKVVVTIADFFLNIYGRKNPCLRSLGQAINRLDMLVWRKLPLIFTRAKTTRAYLAQSGVPAARVVPVYDPCDTNIYYPQPKDPCRQRWSFAPDEIILVHHGILHPNKGNDLIIASLPDVLPQCPALRFLLIGDGPELPRLQKMVAAHNLQKIVTFAGWLDTPAEVNEALNAGDIGLVMRVGLDTDHFSMTGTLVHNMACALPVLAARLNSIREVIRDGENGYLFDPTNMAEFKAKLIRLALNPVLRKKFGSLALAAAGELFDKQKITQQMVEPLLKLCVDAKLDYELVKSDDQPT